MFQGALLILTGLAGSFVYFAGFGQQLGMDWESVPAWVGLAISPFGLTLGPIRLMKGITERAEEATRPNPSIESRPWRGGIFPGPFAPEALQAEKEMNELR